VHTGLRFIDYKLLTIPSENGVPPPGAIISARKMMDDPRAEPQYRERVLYVVKAGAPGARLTDRVVSPEEMLKDKYFEPASLCLTV
jgi:DNA polymerase zeta